MAHMTKAFTNSISPEPRSGVGDGADCMSERLGQEWSLAGFFISRIQVNNYSPIHYWRCCHTTFATFETVWQCCLAWFARILFIWRELQTRTFLPLRVRAITQWIMNHMAVCLPMWFIISSWWFIDTGLAVFLLPTHNRKGQLFLAFILSALTFFCSSLFKTE